jgi:hypothetical protein
LRTAKQMYGFVLSISDPVDHVARTLHSHSGSGQELGLSHKDIRHQFGLRWYFRQHYSVRKFGTDRTACKSISILLSISKVKSRDSSVGIVMGYGLDDPGSVRRQGKIVLSSTASRPVLKPTEPPNQRRFPWG